MSEFLSALYGCFALAVFAIFAITVVGVLVAATMATIAGIVTYRVVAATGKFLVNSCSRA